MKRLTLILWVTASMAFNHTFAQAVLISQFDFNGNLNDNLTNSLCVSYNNSSTSFSAGSFNWVSDSAGAGGGLKVTLPGPIFTNDCYSVAIRFRLSETDGYRKIMDVSARETDAGLYVNSSLRIFSFGNAGSTTIPPDSMITILMTRNTQDDSVKLYLWDGNSLQLESTGVDFNFDMLPYLGAANPVLHFFTDDSVTVSEYSMGGSVDMIKIWNGVATLTDLVGVDENSTTSNLKVYPNPTDNLIHIDLPQISSGEIEIYSISGELVQINKFDMSTKIQISLDKLPAGMYLLKHEGRMVRVVKQ
jgi:hypothetical protein